MTRGIPNSEPAGSAADAFYVLCLYGGDDGLTVTALHRAIVAENDSLGEPAPGRQRVLGALHNLARGSQGLVEQLGRGRDARWRITDHGHRMLAVWCGEDDGPVRVPCGLGWP